MDEHGKEEVEEGNEDHTAEYLEDDDDDIDKDVDGEEEEVDDVAMPWSQRHEDGIRQVSK